MKKPLIVLEIANNHMGDRGHGQQLIERLGNVVERYNSFFEFGLKVVLIRWHAWLGGPTAFGLGAIFPGWEVVCHGCQSVRDR